MTQLTTTLNRIQAHGPFHGWKKLLAGLGKTRADDEPLPFATILRINGLDDALWCVRAEPQHARVWRLFAVWCARRVQNLMRDPRSIAALDVAERYVKGMATDDELRVAEDDARAAWAAAFDARAAALAVAREAEWDAARAAALAVSDAAEAAARAVALDAARDAADAAAWAAEAASRAVARAASRDAAREAAWDAARDGERDAQAAEFLRLVGGE
jgi:hypothetical protein